MCSITCFSVGRRRWSSGCLHLTFSPMSDWTYSGSIALVLKYVHFEAGSRTAWSPDGTILISANDQQGCNLQPDSCALHLSPYLALPHPTLCYATPTFHTCLYHIPYLATSTTQTQLRHSQDATHTQICRTLNLLQLHHTPNSTLP